MLEIFGFIIDFSFWINFIDLPLFQQASVLFALGGWVIVANYVLHTAAEKWVGYRNNIYTSKWQWVLLAVDVPPLFVQTPKAVEQIFAQLSGALGGANVQEKFWKGKSQKSFSLEIISIEGYIQFLVRTEVEFRDLVEASIYAQYPEAEITEVEDYVNNIPDSYPNNEYDVMGVEFKLAQDDSFPIRRYSEFEYSLSKDAVFSDPMAAILENFTRIAHGENLWMQIVVEPTGSGWKEEGIALAKDLLKGGGKKKSSGGGNIIIDLLTGAVSSVVTDFLAYLFGGGGGGGEAAKEEKVEITPGTKRTVEGIEEKISKIGFKTKLRVLYAAKKEVYSPGRCVSGFVGSISQFSIQNSNAIVPFKATSAKYDSSGKKANALKSSFVQNFKGRGMGWKSCDGYVLNIEELATLWHFPLPFVKTPLLHKAGHKRAEPPAGLPIETMESPLKPKLPPGSGSQPSEQLPPPPEELPYG